MKDRIEKLSNINELLMLKLRRNVVLDYIYAFICNLNMSNSIWVLYLTYRGMNLLQIGLLEGIFHITGMFTEIPSGAMADLFGRKRSMIVGRIFLTMSCIVMLFSRNFMGFAFGFILHAWSYNFNSGSEEALLYDSLKMIDREESYAKINGKINFVIEVSQGIAIVTGGVLAEISYNWCYFVCIVIALLCFMPLVFMTEPPVKSEKTVKEKLSSVLSHHFKTSWNIVKNDKRIFFIVVYYSIIFTAYTVLLFYSQQFFQNHGLNKIQISIIMLFAGLSACAGALSSNTLMRIMKDKLAVLGACGIAFCILTFGMNNLYLSAFTLVIASFFNSVLYPAQSSTLNALIPSQQRATLISLNSMAFSIVMVLVFPIVGGLADVWNLSVVFAGLGVFMIIGIAIVQIFLRHEGKLFSL